MKNRIMKEIEKYNKLYNLVFELDELMKEDESIIAAWDTVYKIMTEQKKKVIEMIRDFSMGRFNKAKAENLLLMNKTTIKDVLSWCEKDFIE